MLKEQNLLKKPEDVLTVAIYPQVGIKFLKGEAKPEFMSANLPLPPAHEFTKQMVKSFFPEVEMKNLNFGEPAVTHVGGPASIPTQFNVTVNGEPFEVEVLPTGGYMIAPAGGAPGAPGAAPKDVEGALKSPMQGTILKVKCAVGKKVAAGEVVCILEAMKMEQEIKSDKAGEIKQIFVNEGTTVKANDPIMQIL
jgi:pyruvate carboxylase subunit B